MDQDRGPAQTVKQIEQDKSRPPFAGRGERGRLCQKPGAAMDDGGMNAEHAAGPAPRPIPAASRSRTAGRLLPRAASRRRTPKCASGHIAEAVRDRKRGGFRWSTLTGRGPRARAVRRHGDCWPVRQPASRPEAERLLAFQRVYSSNNTNPARDRPGFCIVYLWRQIIKSCLKERENRVNGRLN